MADSLRLHRVQNNSLSFGYFYLLTLARETKNKKQLLPLHQYQCLKSYVVTSLIGQ